MGKDNVVVQFRVRLFENSQPLQRRKMLAAMSRRQNSNQVEDRNMLVTSMGLYNEKLK
jgi:hypothetical protein